jgi:amino acid transporter
MVRYLFLAYIIVYLVIAVGLFSLYAQIVPRDEKKNDPVWETPLDLLLALTGLAGMLFLYLGVQPHWLKIAWRPISVAILLVQIWGNLKSRVTWNRSPEASQEKGLRAAADLTTLVFLAPSLILNLYYAFY